MPLEPSELQRLSRLLDQVLGLPEGEREEWLANLGGDDARFGPVLRDHLAQRDTDETVELLAPMHALAGLDVAEPDGDGRALSSRARARARRHGRGVARLPL